MIRKINKILLWTAFLPLLIGCQTDDMVQETIPEGIVTARLAAQGMTEGNASDEESKLNTLQGYRFDDGVLSEVFQDLKVDADGVCRFRPMRLSGEVYFWANASDVEKKHDLSVGITTLDDFMHIKADAEAMTSGGILMTGRIVLTSGMVSTTLRRSVARIDLESFFEGVEVHNVMIKGVATTGYVNTQTAKIHPEAVETTDLVKTFKEEPFKNRKAPIFYVCEQAGDGHDVEVEVTVNGIWHRLRTVLPPMTRNTVYTLKVYGKGTSAHVKVVAGTWESGDSSESSLQQKGWIDREASQLSEGVRLSEAGDTVYAPYWESRMQLALRTKEGLGIRVNGRAEGTTIALRTTSKPAQAATVEVESARRMPGTLPEYVYLDLYKGDVLNGRIVLAFSPNPLRVQGRLKFDADGMCDFGTYVDGELALLSTETGKTVTLELDEGEDPWIKLDSGTTPGTFRLLGGWKPNDPKADGRVQTARLILSDTQDGHKETYTIKRRNWGLPVVNINGTWWCKYNLRGSVKDFTNQILVNNDPVPNGDVGEYLRTCTPDNFKALLGDQYQGGNPEGMKVKLKNGKFHYEGFQATATDFGSLAATEMAPDGYEIPDYNDYRFFTNGNNMQLHLGNDAFNNGLGQRLSFKITERNDVTFDGMNYGPIRIYDYKFEGTGTRWVMVGLGSQFGMNPGDLSNMIILLATNGKTGQTWFLEGYGQNNGNKTWFKYKNNESQKTRAIRCIKTPVEYVYD